MPHCPSCVQETSLVRWWLVAAPAVVTMVWLAECCSGDFIGADGAVGRSRFYCCRDLEASEVEQAEEADKFEVLHQYSTDKTVTSPPVPYFGEIPVALHTGRTITVAGNIFRNATRLSVNLMCGSGEDADLALHLNPRFDLDQVVRNSRIAGRWGDEEVAALARNPMRRGHTFLLTIFVAEHEFLISVNGRHFCSYEFRVPLQRVVTMAIHGDVWVDSLQHGAAIIYPDPAMASFVEDLPLNRSLREDPLEPPFVGRLPQPFGPGAYLEVVAVLKLAPHSMYVNLQEGQHVWPHPNIALHVNPRFRAGPVPLVAVNTWTAGKWGKEKLTRCLHFFPGLVFTLRTVRNDDRYDVSVNGEHLCSWKPKSIPEVVDTVVVQGDVLIKEITFATEGPEDGASPGP